MKLLFCGGLPEVTFEPRNICLCCWLLKQSILKGLEMTCMMSLFIIVKVLHLSFVWETIMSFSFKQDVFCVKLIVLFLLYHHLKLEKKENTKTKCLSLNLL